MNHHDTIDERCPCGSSVSYASCCAVLHQGTAASTAEALMRSRYSAFARLEADPLLADYLIATWHPSKRRDRVDELRQHAGDTIWDGLEVLACSAGNTGDDSGTVTFCAHFRTHNDGDGEHGGELHERSRFVKEAGRWFYVDGDQLPAIKRGRNDPCWCRSGRKFKQCHGR